MLPQDPFNYKVPQTSQNIVFSQYTQVLAQKDVNAVLLQAANCVVAQLSTAGDGPIGAPELVFASKHVQLTLRPDSAMTWIMLGSALQGFTNFVNLFEFVEFRFIIYEPSVWIQMSTMGSGSLTYYA